MPDNTHRFTGRAGDYSRFRQRYPCEDILSRLRQWCGLTRSWFVADIGAGTGMASDVFLSNGNPVIAIEPNLDMLAHMRRTYAQPHPHASQLQILQATAEATTLPDASVDLIVIGRALHWFDRDRALQEFRRILKPNGWIAIIAIDHDRDPKDPAFRDQAESFEKILSEHGTDYVRVRSGFDRYEEMTDFLERDLHQAQLHGSREMDWENFWGHTMSFSVAPQPSHPKHEAFARELRRHFDTYALNGVLIIPTVCWISAGRFC